MLDLESQIAPLLARADDEVKSGHLPAAHALIEEAEKISPADPRVLNLRALYFFRAQRFEEARLLYLRLIEQTPDDSSLFLNLGIVELKLERFVDAAAHLQQVVDRDPHDQRTQSYLGLARLRLGDASAASVAFGRAGRDELAQNLAVHAQRDELLAAHDREIQLRDEELLADINGATKSALPSEEALSVAAFATQRLLVIPPGEAFGLTGGGFLIIAVDGQQATRTTGALVSSGTLSFSPLSRRVRGQATDEQFGDGGEPGGMMVAQGNGILLFARGDGMFTVLDLAEDILYLRETELFAFDLGLHWESGRIPGRANDPVRIVQVRGTGRVVLRSKAKLYTLKTAADSTLFVDAGTLRGWIGRVVPRFVVADGQPTNLIDCAGEGMLILEEP